MDISVRFGSANSRAVLIRNALTALNGLQKHYHYISEEADASDRRLIGDDPIDPGQFFDNIQGVRVRNEYVIYVTERPFVDNWFSHEEDNVSVVTTSDWERNFAPPSLQSYLAYQIAQASISFEAQLTEEMLLRLVHVSSNGCMFDLCMDKDEIKLGMAAGVICPSCQAVLRQYGLGDDSLRAVGRILQYVRMNAVGTPPLVVWNNAFVAMRYTENDENDHAYRYGIRPAIEEAGLNCVRVDEQQHSGGVLDAVRMDIQRSRFVVVKVDEPNLNVYFELGYAMALEKDILLVCDTGLVRELPTDLLNTICVTYTRGGYEELKENLKARFLNEYRVDLTAG